MVGFRLGGLLLSQLLDVVVYGLGNRTFVGRLNGLLMCLEGG